MLKAEIKKEVTLTNKEVAEFLWKDGSFLEQIDEILGNMLYDTYGMDCDSRCDALDELTAADYSEILIFLANKLIG